jgi:hypothetical protein
MEHFKQKSQLSEKPAKVAFFLLCLIVVALLQHETDREEMKNEIHFIISNSVMTNYTIPDDMQYGGEQAQGRCLLPNGNTQLLRTYFNTL